MKNGFYSKRQASDFEVVESWQNSRKLTLILGTIQDIFESRGNEFQYQYILYERPVKYSSILN